MQLVDESGKIVNRYSYDEWGNLLASYAVVENPIRYCGEYYDKESGYYYLRARYYDPRVGRFISEDTFEGQVDNPLSLNLYTYCANNPIMYTDPSGHYYIVKNKDGSYTATKDNWLKTTARNILGTAPFLKSAVEAYSGVVGGNSATDLESEYKGTVYSGVVNQGLKCAKVGAKSSIITNGIFFVIDTVAATNTIIMDKAVFDLLGKARISTTSNSLSSLENLMNKSYGFVGANKDYFLNNTIFNKTLYELDNKLSSFGTRNSAREKYVNGLLFLYSEQLNNNLGLTREEQQGYYINFQNYLNDYKDRLNEVMNIFSNAVK